jgi:hypothetical protein
MTLKRLVVVGAIAAAAYYTVNMSNSTDAQDGQDGSVPNDADVSCPEGYLLSDDKQSCLELDADGKVMSQDTEDNPCPDGMVLSDDGNCACPAGQIYDGNKCVKDLNINTGSAIGDMAANIGISIGTGIIAQTAVSAAASRAFAPRGSGAARAAATAAKKEAQAAAKAAAAAERKVAQTAAAAAERKVAQTAAAKAAQIAERKVAQVAAAKASMLAAKSAKATVVAVKAAKATSLIGRAMAGPGVIFSILFTVIAQSLIALLDLRPNSFEACKNGEFDFSTLPGWATSILGGLPFVGDIFDMFSPVLCFQGGCSDPDSENQNGLCYKKPLPGWKCESFLCYKDYPEFENNGMLHTFAHVTKKILMDTGTIPETPPPDTVKSGLLYYKDPGPDYNVVAGVAWQKCPSGFTDTLTRCEDVYGNGIGRIP